MSVRLFQFSIHWRRAVWPFVLATTVLFASGWKTAPATPFEPWIGMDKVVHFLVFGLLATLIARSIVSIRSKLCSLSVAFFLTALVGCADELRQAVNPVRDFSVADLGADLLGAAVALTLYGGWSTYRRLLEWPLPVGNAGENRAS